MYKIISYYMKPYCIILYQIIAYRIVPVMPHEAVPEVSKGKLYKNQKKSVPIGIDRDFVEHFPFDFARDPFLMMTRTTQ